LRELLWGPKAIRIFLSGLELLTDPGHLILARLELRGRAEISASDFFLRGFQTVGEVGIVPSHLVLHLLEMPGEFRMITSQLSLAGLELVETLVQICELARDRLAPLRQFGRDRSGSWTSVLSRGLSLR
jgi:hypothetical protein